MHKLIEDAKNVDKILEDLVKKAQQLQNQTASIIRDSVKTINHTNIDEKALQALLKKHWTVVAKGDNEFVLVVPKIYDINFGWLIWEDEAWRHFRVNQLTNWISDIPDEIKKELNFAEPLDVKIQGDYLVGKDIDKISEKFSRYTKKYGDRLIIKQGSRFDLISGLVRQGIMPFDTNPVSKDLLYHREIKFELRDYQKEVVEKFMHYSHIGIFIPTAGGKTYISLKAMSEIKPPYLIVTNKTLIEQWKARIEGLTEIKEDEYDIFTYQGAIKKAHNRKYNLAIIDEVHHLPADEYSQLIQIPFATSMGLSASPFREDGREDLIITFTGYPIKVKWSDLKELGYLKIPSCHVWIVRTQDEKYKILDKLVDKDQKTFIYSDSIDLGNQISKRYSIPFVHGESTERMKTIENHKIIVLSRVGDEGISSEEIEQVIEMDWHGTSRRQSLQRAGRLTHGTGKKEGEHHIIMTIQEYASDKRRLVPLIENGFKTFYHSDISEIDEKVREMAKDKTKKPKEKAEHVTESKAEELDIIKYPLLKYLGVKKSYQSLSGIGEKKILLFFIDPENQDKSFTIQNLRMNMGYANEPNVHRVLRPLLKKQFIIKKDGKYQQNFSSMIQ